jgi:peptidoglycan/LPS O-acetylase OafA/YrhL
MKNKIEVIDFLKGYSILTIVVFHFCQGLAFSPLLAKLINFGGTGIHTFLFASGFGLYLSHLKKPLRYPDFLRKRFTKIYVPYIIIVSLSALISLVIPIYENNWNNYLSHVFFYKMFDDHLIGTYGYQFWFVSTIIQFYLLFPLFVFLREKIKGKGFLLVGLLISLSWTTIVLLLHKEALRNWNSFFLQYVWEFMLGMYCAEGFLKRNERFWEMSKMKMVLLTVAGLALYSAMALKGGQFGKSLNDIPALFGYGGLAVLIYLAGVQAINQFILFTARLSFSIFLLHFLVLDLFNYAVVRSGGTWSWIWLIPTLTLCYIFAIPLEKFLNKLIDQLLQTPVKTTEYSTKKVLP